MDFKNTAIITGGSSGIGKALTELYVQNGYQVYTLSRSLVSDSKNPVCISADLSKTTETSKAITGILDLIDTDKLKNFVLINNAGTLGPLTTIEQQSSEAIRHTLHTNLTAPMILTAMCLQRLANTPCSKRVLNISSGAAAKPYDGWTGYCASKAGLDMLTKTVALEQEHLENGAKISAVYPGVVETEMQVTLRKASETAFRNAQRFVDLKKEDKLYSPEFVAHKILELDTRGLLKNGEIVDIRNL